MLILTRRPNESILIGKDISVVVMGISGQQVRLGITASKGLAVDREEIAIRKAGGSSRPVAPQAVDEPLYANRTEAEWRQLLADEAEEQNAWNKESGHDAA
ncbi:carbon storage regulator [Pseudomonas protegens]|nr:carbon storage regulator [Pseudomonas protegens]